MTISGFTNVVTIYINNFSYTDATTFKNAMKGVYLYYELETPITMMIDGNEAVAQIKNDLNTLEFGEVAGGKNLLNPIWKTSSNNGVNFINNGDGSFTIKGTVVDTGLSSYSESILIPVEVGKSYKLTGNCISVYKKDNIQSLGGNNSTTSEYTFTAIEDAVNICLYVEANTDNIDITSKYMLTEATNTSEYEPYIPSVKALAEGKADKSETTVNLLKPTLQTSTSNGITCTNNGDGTYTFNGTSTAEATFIVEYIGDIVTKYVNKDLRLVGCPKNGSKNTYRLQIWSDSQEPVYDFGDGVKIHIKKATGNANVAILFGKDITVNNLVFKPMLTTNLSTTYDDFVPYTGDGETLASDVAEIKNDILFLSDHFQPMSRGYNTVPTKENFLLGEGTGIYFVFYSFGTSSYTVDLVIMDTDGVRIVSQNPSANIAYWKLENNLYLTNNTSGDIRVARTRIL